MKTILLLLCVLTSYICKSQDSVKIVISVQARDIEYIGSFIFNDYSTEDLYDTLKIKYRIANPQNATTTISISGYTQDWVTVVARLNNDATALKANCTSRLITLLRAVNQPYLTGKIDTMELADTNTFQSMRQFGKSKYKRL